MGLEIVDGSSDDESGGGWADVFSGAASKIFNSAVDAASKAVGSQVVSAIGPAPTGNLSQAQINAGVKPGVPTIKPSSGGLGGNVRLGAASIPLWALLAGVAGGAYLIFKRRR